MNRIGDGEEVVIEMEGKFVGHKGAVYHATYFEKFQKLISCSYDHTIIIWDINTFKAEKILEGHSSLVNYIVIWDEDGVFFSCGNSGLINRWDLRNPNIENKQVLLSNPKQSYLYMLKLSTKYLLCIEFSFGHLIIVDCEKGDIFLQRKEDNISVKSVAHLSHHFKNSFYVSFTSEIKLFNYITNTILREVKCSSMYSFFIYKNLGIDERILEVGSAGVVYSHDFITGMEKEILQEGGKRENYLSSFISSNRFVFIISSSYNSMKKGEINLKVFDIHQDFRKIGMIDNIHETTVFSFFPVVENHSRKFRVVTCSCDAEMKLLRIKGSNFLNCIFDYDEEDMNERISFLNRMLSEQPNDEDSCGLYIVLKSHFSKFLLFRSFFLL